MFKSLFRALGQVKLPTYTGVRVMMMPIILGDLKSVPTSLANYQPTLRQIFSQYPRHLGEVGYLTIDEKLVLPGQTHRRPGLHVDGIYHRLGGGWGRTDGAWGSIGNGMLTVSSYPGCQAYTGTFIGKPGPEGECEHLRDQCKEGSIFQKNRLYWLDGLCVHESLPMAKPVYRQFLRLSMPSKAPWFEGYTKNPLGINPTGQILPARVFMLQ